ncbi:MAG: hypothetical protein AAF378_08545 [Cyanobacteria bacterium P01_A01_bin.84]
MSAQHQQPNKNLIQHQKSANHPVRFFLNVFFLLLGLVGFIVSCQSDSSKDTSDASKQNTVTIPKVTIQPEESVPNPPSVSQSIKATPETSSTSKKSPVSVPSPPHRGNSQQNNTSNTSSKPSPGKPTETFPITQANPNNIDQKDQEFPIAVSPPEKSTSQESNNKYNKYAEYSSKPKGQKIYQNKQLGFSFKYPKGYVVGKNPSSPNAKPGISQQKLDMWTNEDFQAIKAGKFQGTELPASVSISVEKNPKRLNAEQWFKENADEFGSTANQTTRLVAGQKALAFSTADLYESENIVLPTKDSSNIIIISLAQSQNNLDREYKQAFEQVISSFNLRNR